IRLHPDVDEVGTPSRERLKSAAGRTQLAPVGPRNADVVTEPALMDQVRDTDASPRVAPVAVTAAVTPSAVKLSPRSAVAAYPPVVVTSTTSAAVPAIPLMLTWPDSRVRAG